jgi:hypothetical protein
MHHMDLFYSLQLLFEKRLGWELYRPIGMEWWNERLWSVYNHPNTAKQYLSTEQAIEIPKDVHGFSLPQRLRHNEVYRSEDGIYYVEDPSKGKVNRGITLERFRATKFDFLISSMPAHIPIFNELIRRWQPQARHIFQVGNAWGRQPGVGNILASTAPFPVPSDVNVCFYHQEFDLDVFSKAPPSPDRKVFSFIHYMREMELNLEFRRVMPDWEFRTFGGGMEGDLCRSSDIASRLRESAFVWHIKPEGDGFGHIIHNAFAVGRPPIVKMSHYVGKLAGSLMVDGVTCVNIEGLPVEEAARRIRSIHSSDRYGEMCEAASRRFRENVDYDREETVIRSFLGCAR